jgi:hypothetical protein
VVIPDVDIPPPPAVKVRLPPVTLEDAESVIVPLPSEILPPDMFRALMVWDLAPKVRFPEVMVRLAELAI